MRCTRVEKFLPLYVAGDLAGRRAARRVASHLAACAACRGLAAEYDASRDLVLNATLPPDFDGAFYEELRRSVLAEIKRGRTRLAPPPPAGFASLFNARFAYAASLALIVATVAALSLHGYVGRKSVSVARPDAVADTNHAPAATQATTPAPVPAQVQGDERPASSQFDKEPRETASGGAQATTPSPAPQRRTAREGDAPAGTRRGVNLSVNPAGQTPVVHAKRSPHAPAVAAPGARAEEIASGGGNNDGGETAAASEVSRIEIQTSDPNIRIIWLSPKPDAAAQPLK